MYDVSCIFPGHPHFYNTLFGDADEIGLLGAFVSVTSNTNVFTYEMAPVYTLMEGQVFTQIRELVGWDVGDGLFSPGGSISNLYALLLARFKQFPESRNAGSYGLPKMVLFCSEQVSVGGFMYTSPYRRNIRVCTTTWSQ